MQRITNRYQNTLEQDQGRAAQVRYIEVPVERVVEKVVEKIVHVSEPAQIIEKIVEVPVEKTVIQQAEVDLSQIRGHIARHEAALYDLSELQKPIYNELEMQRRVLVALKDQRAVDRARRLQFIKRVKKERDEARKLSFKFKLAIGASLLLSIASLIVKL